MNRDFKPTFFISDKIQDIEDMAMLWNANRNLGSRVSVEPISIGQLFM